MTQYRTTKFNNLKELLEPDVNDYLVIRKVAEGKDYKIRKGNLVSGGGQTLSLEWSSETIYDTPATAEVSERQSYTEFNNKLWKSLVDNNQGNVPQEGVNWTEVSRSESGMVPWSAGVFTQEHVYVTGVPQAGYPECLLRLTSLARPFESTDLEAEYTAEDWEIIGLDAESIGSIESLIINFESDLDNNQDIGFVGVITSLSIISFDGITAVSFETAIDAANPVFAAQATLTDVQTWINSNVTGDSNTGTKWLLRVITDASKQTRAILKYKPS